VALTSRAAWFTDSAIQQLYALPLGRHGGLPGQDEVRTLPLTGDLRYTTGNNLNGIVAARGGRLLLSVQTNTGKLFRINPRTGVTRAVDLGGSCSWSRTATTRSPWSCCPVRWTGAGWWPSSPTQRTSRWESGTAPVDSPSVR
jgi:hypothetical protein